MSISLVFTGAVAKVVENGIGTARERAFNASLLRVVAVVRVASICLTLTRMPSAVVENGIVTPLFVIIGENSTSASSLYKANLPEYI